MKKNEPAVLVKPGSLVSPRKSTAKFPYKHPEKREKLSRAMVDVKPVGNARLRRISSGR